jgi:hypothetical protein
MVQRRGRQSRSVSRRRDSPRRRNPSSRYRARDVDSSLKKLQDKQDAISLACEKLSRQVGQGRDRKTDRGGPVWPCACGFRTNFADRTHCHGCKKLKGEGKAPPPAQPSQRVKPAAAQPVAAAPLPAAHLAASPGATLEAQRKETSLRLVAMKQMATDHPDDTFVAEHVARLEGQLVALKEQIFALKPVAAQLQTALSQVASVDKKVLVAQELVKTNMAALVESQLALGTLLEAQTALQADLARLKADGVEPPPSPGFIDLTVFLDFMKELAQMPAGGNVALLAQAAGRKFGILAGMDVDDVPSASAPAAPPAPSVPKAPVARTSRELSPLSSRGGSVAGRSRSPLRASAPSSRPDPKVWAGFSGGPFNAPLNVPDSQEPGGAGGSTPVAGVQAETPAATLARALLITSTAASSSASAAGV